MPSRPPIVSTRQLLPFDDTAFSWETFEDFFIDFLNARPVLAINDGGTRMERRVIRARPYGRRGDRQHGIDLFAEMDGGEIWDFQCKHYREWGPAQTRKAIAAYKRDAARKFLLITRSVSEKTRAVLDNHPTWYLWDAREITRRFLEDTPKAEAARILHTHFGRGWPEALLGIPSDAALITAKIKFDRFLEPNRIFHHRSQLLGRKDWLDSLDDFVRDEKSRVFLLTAGGGLGKSRLLLEWSKGFAKRHQDHTLRFVSDVAGNFAASIDDSQNPLVIVFDDAHRLEEVRAALLPLLPPQRHIKLVLSLRPAPLAQVRAELLQAGFDSTEIVEPGPIKRLKAGDALALAEQALGPELASRHRHFLASVSRDCPLIAVLGAELFRRGAIPKGDLIDAAEFKTRVFDRMLEDASSVEELFGREATRDLLRLLALIGPAKLNAEFLKKAAEFIGSVRPDQVSQLRDALDDAGFLYTTGAGTRITPDLLSDHLAYDACYDRSGKDRTFAERLLTHFSADQFPRLLQHLAEAEWRAVSENPDADSVVEPLWQWFRERFEQSPFHKRSEQIHEWANIAVLQPQRSLALAKLALNSTSAPAAENEWLRRGDWDTYEKSLEWLPKLLQNVAEYHSEKVRPCLDLLWQLGRDKPPRNPDNKQGHPICVISEVISIKHGKSLDVQRAALTWLSDLLADDKWRNHLHSPAWLLDKFLAPIFTTSVEENWSTGRTIFMRSHLLHLANTADLRERALALCKSLLKAGDDLIALAVIGVLDHALDIPRLRASADVPPDFGAKWDQERMKALALLEHILTNFPGPAVQYRARNLLLHHLRYGGRHNHSFRDSCRSLLRRMSDTLDLRIVRTAFGSYHEEFVRPARRSGRDWLGSGGKDWQRQAKARWESFALGVAEAVVQTYSPDALVEHTVALHRRLKELGFEPSFAKLYAAIGRTASATGVRVAEVLLGLGDLPLIDAFEAVVSSATRNDDGTRLRLIKSAAGAGEEHSACAAVLCCTSWREEGDLPEEAYALVEQLTSEATSRLGLYIARFVWWKHRDVSLRDWQLLASIPFSSTDSWLAAHIAHRAADLVTLAKLAPSSEAVRQFLSRFQNLEQMSGSFLERGLAQLGEAFSVEVFLMLWRRNEQRKAGNANLDAPGIDVGTFKLADLLQDQTVKDIVTNLEIRLLEGESLDYEETKLLRTAILRGTDDPSVWFESAMEKADTEEQLKRLWDIACGWGFGSIAMEYPLIARAFLLRARTFGSEAHQRMFARLASSTGMRGSVDGEPDESWKRVFESMERLAEEYSEDSELGPLFANMVKSERAQMEFERKRGAWDDDDE